MDTRLYMVLLLDFYGKLLSDKQYSAMKAYYYEDYSIVEIAEENGVSKQAISNLILRAEDRLREIEENLELLDMNISSSNRLKEMLRTLESEACAEEKLKAIKEDVKVLLADSRGR